MGGIKLVLDAHVVIIGDATKIQFKARAQVWRRHFKYTHMHTLVGKLSHPFLIATSERAMMKSVKCRLPMTFQGEKQRKKIEQISISKPHRNRLVLVYICTRHSSSY